MGESASLVTLPENEELPQLADRKPSNACKMVLADTNACKMVHADMMTSRLGKSVKLLLSDASFQWPGINFSL